MDRETGSEDVQFNITDLDNPGVGAVVGFCRGKVTEKGQIKVSVRVWPNREDCDSCALLDLCRAGKEVTGQFLHR
jgi:hypothetical protein